MITPPKPCWGGSSDGPTELLFRPHSCQTQLPGTCGCWHRSGAGVLPKPQGLLSQNPCLMHIEVQIGAELHTFNNESLSRSHDDVAIANEKYVKSCKTSCLPVSKCKLGRGMPWSKNRISVGAQGIQKRDPPSSDVFNNPKPQALVGLHDHVRGLSKGV